MRSLRFILCLVLSAVMVFSLTGCQPKEQIIEWNLYGTWFSEGVAASEEMEIFISGVFPAELGPDSGAQVVELSLCLPDSLPYKSEHTSYSVHTFTTGDNSETVVLWINGFSYRADTGVAVRISFFVCPEKECAVFQWSDNKNAYLVASTDPDADPAEIMELFKDLLP